MPPTINAPTSLGTNGVSSAGQTSISRLYSSSASVGDCVWVTVAFGLGSTPTSMAVSDDAGNTFTLAAQADKITNQTPHVWLYFCVLTNAITSANRLTITPSTSFNMPVMLIARATITGGSWSGAIDKTASSTGSSATVSSGATMTTTSANQLAVSAVCLGIPETITWTNGNTGLDSLGTTSKLGADAYQILASAGTPQASGTITSNDWAAVIATMAASSTSPPANTVAPVVSGTPHVGSALGTTNGTWTDDGSPTFSYQWQRDNQGGGVYSDISSATSSSYTLVDADDGCNIRCVVTDSTPDGNTSANSNSVGLVTEPVPTNSVAPSVSGSATVGSVLSTTNGTWTHMGGTVATFAYQWTRAGVNISSATSSTYTTVSADIGHAIGCTVTATNDGGSGTPTASSNTITVTSGGGGGASQDFGALIAAHVI